MSSWTWLAGRRLKEIVNKSITHLELIHKTTELLRDMIKLLYEGKVNEGLKFYEKIGETERKADELKRDILHSLSRGFIHPLDREDLLRLILTSDDIAAYAKATARRIIILYTIGGTLPEEILFLLKDIAEKTVEASSVLLSALRSLGSDPARTITLTHEVEKIEEEIDEIRMDLLEKLYKLCKVDLTIDCLLTKEIIDDVESISDMCEDTGDVIRLIAVSI